MIFNPKSFLLFVETVDYPPLRKLRNCEIAGTRSIKKREREREKKKRKKEKYMKV